MVRHPEKKGRPPAPSSTPRGSQRRVVTQFVRRELIDIHDRVLDYVEMTPNPDITRDGIIAAVATKSKERARISDSLDVLNQLSLLGRQPEDIRTIFVYALNGTEVTKNPGEEKDRPGEGGPHYEYQFDWIRPPRVRSKSQPRQPKPQEPSSDINRERTRIRDQNRVQMSAFENMSRRVALDKMVIDPIADTAYKGLDSGTTIIGTNEEGEAVVLFSYFGNDNHNIVDRSDGKFPAGSQLGLHLEPGIFQIYNEVANQIEGKPSDEYSSAPLPPSICADTYDQVLANGMLRLIQTDQGVEFGYANDPGGLMFELIQLLKPDFRTIDLESSTVRMSRENYEGTRHRPVHPDFAEFLRQKKAEYDARNAE